MRTAIRIFAVPVFALGLALASFQAFAQKAPPSAGPWFGLWQYDTAATAAANHQPPPSKPAVPRFFRMVQVGDDAFYYTIETAPGNDGKHVVQSAAVARFDGKGYTEVGDAFADANKFKIVDPRTYELYDVVDGKDVLHFRITISADNKTRTSVMTRLDADKNTPPRISIAHRVR